MVQENGGSITVTHTLKLTADISALYLNKKFSDVTLIVDGQKLDAHKVILAARSEYFEALLYGDSEEVSQNEVTITGATPESFQIFLKYIYTGSMTLEQSKAGIYLEVLGLAHQYSFKQLETSLSKKVESLLNSKNICNVLNMANLYEMNELIEVCHQFLEKNPKELISNDGLNNLNQTSMVKLLQRDTFVLPELEIFNLVSKWRKSNEDLDALALNCVRLSQMSVVEIVSKIWSSKMVECEKLLEAIAEIVDVRPKTTKCRSQSLIDVNLASTENEAKVISGITSSFLLTGNRDVTKYAECGIGDKNGITIELGNTYLINHIYMMLWDKDLRSYMYYVEVSCNKDKWKKVLDYSNYSCRSSQNLYFEPQVAKYIRVVGTRNTITPGFHLVFFEAYYKRDIPKIVNNIICPTTNVATMDKKAVVIEGIRGELLINGDYKNYDGTNGFTYHMIGSGCITVQLAQPYMVSTIKLLLWDGDARAYKYYIETSVNKIDWEMAVDRRNMECKSWQHLTFTERVTVFIRITGTYNSSNEGFHCVHLECPANST